MGAPVLTAPVERDQDGLRFEAAGGPVVALCGLVGGAGTSTLAYLLARQAARESSAAVLLCEGEALAGGLAVLAGCSSPLGLTDLAALIDTGEHPDGAPFARIEDGLRLLATLPRQSGAARRQATGRVLSDARAAHGLVVVDCRTLDHPEAAGLLSLATHVLWVLPATDTAIAHADVLLACGALPAPRRAREALVAVATQPRVGASVRELRLRAGERIERLLLVPHVPELPRKGASGGEAVPSTLAQIATFLRRSP